jgi:hypothetical protein
MFTGLSQFHCVEVEAVEYGQQTAEVSGLSLRKTKRATLLMQVGYAVYVNTLPAYWTMDMPRFEFGTVHFKLKGFEYKILTKLATTSIILDQTVWMCRLVWLEIGSNECTFSVSCSLREKSYELKQF